MARDAETPPPYSPDWAEATGEETLYKALARHLTEIDRAALAPGDVALFRMAPRGPAKHCGIVGEKDGAITLIHARQNRRVCEEPFSRSGGAGLPMSSSLNRHIRGTTILPGALCHHVCHRGCVRTGARRLLGPRRRSGLAVPQRRRPGAGRRLHRHHRARAA